MKEIVLPVEDLYAAEFWKDHFDDAFERTKDHAFKEAATVANEILDDYRIDREESEEDFWE